MSTKEELFIFLLLGLCTLPLVIPYGLFIYRTESKRKYELFIVMDGTYCLKKYNDTSLVFKRRKGRNFSILVFLVLALLGSIAALVSTFSSTPRGELTEAVDDSATLLIVTFILGTAILVLSRSLLTPSICINGNTKMIEIGRGRSIQQVPFSSISNVAAQGIDAASGLVPGYERIEINIILEDGDRIQLGSVSGSGADKKADDLIRLVSGLTVAPGR